MGFIYDGHEHQVIAVAWSPDGTRIASSARDALGVEEHFVQVWEPETGSLFFTCDAHHVVTSIDWSPDGSMFATGGFDRVVQVWNGRTGHLVSEYPTPLNTLYDLAWSPDGTRLVLAGEDNVAPGEPVANPVLDAITGHVHTLYQGHSGIWTEGVAWSPDSIHVASTGHDDYTFQIWNAVTGESIVRCEVSRWDEVGVVAWSPDGKVVASGVHSGPVRLHDATTGAVVSDMHDEFVWPSALAWSPDGRWIAASTYEDGTRVWRATTGEVRDVYTGFRPRWDGKPFAATCISWSPDGTQIAIGSLDQTVHIWTL